jgi:uncharacterized protein YeaO (DUF488 family)
MTGVLRETHYDEVRSSQESDQSQLSEYLDSAGPTTIAVVRKPRDTGIEDYCDEWMPELGMPERHLKRFWEYRAGYRTNSAVSNPTSRAYDDANCEYHYRQHIRTSDSAQKALSAIVRRLKNGEDITLVCFEEPSEPCHRYVLMETIESRLESDYDFNKRELTV